MANQDLTQEAPSAAIYSDDGKPLLSSRVLILSLAEEGELFEQFRLNERGIVPTI